jgi:hypothetical protein
MLNAQCECTLNVRPPYIDKRSILPKCDTFESERCDAAGDSPACCATGGGCTSGDSGAITQSNAPVQ